LRQRGPSSPDEGSNTEPLGRYVFCCFAGNALPVIGVGVISTVAGATAASLAFAVAIGGFALVALVSGIRYLPK
jgi:hypothetical protein